MKKVLLLMIPALLIGFAGCKKTDDDNEGKAKKEEVVKPVQNAMIYYASGTWCGPCGQYGKPTLQKAKELDGRVKVISAQLNGGVKDPFNNQFADQVAVGFGVKGVPSLFLAGKDGKISMAQGGTGMWPNTEARIREVLGTGEPSVYAKPKVKVDGNSIKIDINATFYEDYPDEYRFAVYVTESRLEAPQYMDARIQDKNMHDDILRLCLNSEIFGDVVAPSVKAGDKVSKSFTGTLDPSWKKENLKAVVVFFRKTGDKQVTYVNGETTNFK